MAPASLRRASPSPSAETRPGRTYFSALQHFTYATDERQGGLKVATRRYVYWVHTEARQRYALLNWHWHPPEVRQPHLHVGVQHPTLGDLERFHPCTE